MPKETRKVPNRTVTKDSVVAALDNSVKMPTATRSTTTASQANRGKQAQAKAIPKAKPKQATPKTLAKSKDPEFIKTSVYFKKELLNQLKIKKLQMNFEGDISDLVGEAVQKLIDSK